MKHNDGHTPKAIPTGIGEAERMQAMDESTPAMNEPTSKAMLVHVKHFVVRCQTCSTPEQQVIMIRETPPEQDDVYTCQRCGNVHILTDEEMALHAEDGQPTGTDKRAMVWK